MIRLNRGKNFPCLCGHDCGIEVNVCGEIALTLLTLSVLFTKSLSSVHATDLETEENTPLIETVLVWQQDL